jgi:hypothetical protein
VERLERDLVQGMKEHFVEFICQACGLGFRVVESHRVQMANRLFKEHREMRVPTDGKDRSEQEFNAVCKRKFHEIKHAAIISSKRAVGQEMKDWMTSDEARELREAIKRRNAPLAQEGK